ncbi:HAMP domain-containing sensor histidine kinase [Paenibacillus sp. VCA1]|uniref:sensor histidine kinase n=1 Tax=Paenibacillus sp. VCA1 TaxID=3039148 RepID=UPI0028716802|nr:HAMP domain-containing sensor histidine kinase [Paenibacillus sp. VCA1]MDR9853211.1 HAMP domain-containing sensor histidine kinase [Paenibacillus sp. VCA1]
MFRKLRNRFLLMNMAIITIIMLVAFTAIYTITYQNVRRDIGMELQRVSEFYHKEGGPGKKDSGKTPSSPGAQEESDAAAKAENGRQLASPLDSGTAGREPDTADSGSEEVVGPSSNGGNGGSVQTGDSGSSQPLKGEVDMHRLKDGGQTPPPELSVAFELKTDREWNLLKTNSRFEMDADFYEAAKKQAAQSPVRNGQVMLDGTRWAYSVLPTPNGYSVVYLDVTAQLKIIKNLIYTFLAVALVMLAVIYATSRYFANRSIEPVRKAFDKQKQFIADASHELKTPLAVINTNADVLLANGEETILSQSKWLQHIKSETERMKTLTNDLLYLTQMDDGPEHVIFVPFDLSEAVESVMLTMEAVIFEKELAFTYEIEPRLTITGSSEQVKQVVMILLDNAIKYANPGGAIHLELKKQHNRPLLTVTNTGAGIAPEHLNHIFDRFYRADVSRSRKHGGYGLGLAIAKSIVEGHKGKISAKSVPNGKTSFYVQLG